MALLALTYGDLKCCCSNPPYDKSPQLTWLCKQAPKWKPLQRILLSATPLLEVPTTPQNLIRCVDAPPKGLWYSFGSTMVKHLLKTYAIEELLSVVGFVYEVVPASTILTIKNPEGLDTFTRSFGKASNFTTWLDFICAIDWRQVATAHTGIEVWFCPERRHMLRTSWYYSWDYARGCLWAPEAIASSRLLASYTTKR